MLGERIKLKRKEMKWTQKAIAEHLGIDHTTVSKWESGTYEPDTATLNKLADLFRVSVDWLTGRIHHSTIELPEKNQIRERNVAYFKGVKEELTEEEAERLKEELEMIRLLKAKREREKQQESRED